MDIDDRLEYWSDWRDQIEGVIDEVKDALSQDFAPKKTRKCKSMKGDKDADAVRDLLQKLHEVKEYVEANIERTEEEARRQEDAIEMAYAWSLGLCPSVMMSLRKTSHGKRSGSYDSLNWDGISEYLQAGSMSREWTMSAVKAWEARMRKAV